MFLGCSSAGKSAADYAANRGRDLRDIVNLSVEKDVYGFYIQPPIPFYIGYQKGASGTAYGLRYGNFGEYQTGDPNNPILDNKEYNTEKRYFGDFPNFPNEGMYYKSLKYSARMRGKSLLEFVTSDKGFQNVNACKLEYKGKILSTGKKYCSHSKSGSISYRALGNVEMFIGLKYGIKIGFSSAETFDFLLGIFGFDPKEDDIGWLESDSDETLTLEDNEKILEKTFSWSAYSGKMNWDEAVKKCKSLKMDLPTKDEILSAIESKETENWAKDGDPYWTKEAKSPETAKTVSVGLRLSDDESIKTVHSARCIRQLKRTV